MTNKRKSRSKRARDAKEPRFKTRARALGLRAGIDPSRFNQLADDLEADTFWNFTNKLKSRNNLARSQNQ